MSLITTSVSSQVQEGLVKKVPEDNKKCTPSDESVKKTAVKVASFAIPFFIHFLSFFSIVTTIARTYFWVKRRNFANSLALKRLEALKRGVQVEELKIKSSEGTIEIPGGKIDLKLLWKHLDILNIEEKEIEEFKKNVLELIKLINEPVPFYRTNQDHVENTIRPLLSKLYKSRVYQISRDKGEFKSPSVILLQTLAAELYVGADAEEEFTLKGKLESKNVEPNYWGLKEALDKTILGSVNLNTNSILGKIFYAIMHPHKVFFGLGAKVNGIGYNDCFNGNGYNSWGTLKFGDVEVVHVLGPTNTGDNVYEMYLDFLKSHNAETYRHDLQSPYVKGEDERVEYVEERSKSHQEMHYFRTDFNGPIWHAKTPGMKSLISSEPVSCEVFVSRFMDEFKLEMKIDQGYYQKELTDTELELMFKHAKNLFKNSSKTSASWQELLKTDKGRKRLAQMMQFVTQELMVVKILSKISNRTQGADSPELEKLKRVSLIQGCKQDVDRGIPHNIMIRLLSKIYNGEFTKEDVYSMVGVANRAVTVVHRKMMEDKYQPLADYLQLNDNDDGGGCYGYDYDYIHLKKYFLDEYKEAQKAQTILHLEYKEEQTI